MLITVEEDEFCVVLCNFFHYCVLFCFFYKNLGFQVVVVSGRRSGDGG